ncbi:response regulator receiver protein [Rhodovulum imhoffii]|uniref:Response regulator receiver protein n=1 Tax=Rhodovulum imhoffii TaxID=365340 RepID=A0A2T5BRI8_9RHOB|nr:response regulator [Rhodovulum imhoffii]MBK5934002.1 two-component system response regulator [Rhodovulum imhoffii]PTN01887.1 response regulator receiver protein [Rhodovulum imhoffii]
MTIRVLAIDDSRTIRDLLRATLEDSGFDYHCAEDGVAGVERFQDVRPDVVIVDINMPRLDGFGVIDALRRGEAPSSVPIIVLTTECSPDMKARARDAGATGWIVKPFDDVALVSVLRRVTGHAA